MFKDQFPATWAAVMKYRQMRAHYEPTGKCSQGATGEFPSALPATLPLAAAERQVAAPAACPSASFRLSITLADGDATSVRIARDGDALTATIALDRLAPLNRVGGGAR